MRKTNFYLALLALVGMVLTGCTTYSYTSRSVNIRKHNINDTSIAASIRVDYKKQVSGSSQINKVKAEAIREAEYNCLMESGVDVIVDPIIKLEYRPFSGYKAEIQGFAGYYKESKQGFEYFVEQGFKKEDIEKYLILTDPDFREMYYQKTTPEGRSEVVNYYIKTTSLSTNQKATVAQTTETTTVANQTKAKKAKKEKAKKEKVKKDKDGNFFTRLFSGEQQ